MISKVIEAVVTHTADTITVGEIVKEVPELPEKYVQNQMSILVKKGFLEKSTRRGQKGTLGATPRTYRIKTRQTVPSPAAAKAKRDLERDKKAHEIMDADERNRAIKRTIDKPETRTDLSSAETGRSVILAYNDLQREFFEVNAKNEDLQSAVNKERTARRVAVKDRDKTIEDLKKQLVLVRGKCKELEHNGDSLKFPLGNTPRMTALNGRKM